MRFAPFLQLIIWTSCWSVTWADSVSTGEARAIRGLGDTIRQYRTYIEDKPVTSWDQVAAIDVNLHGIRSGFKNEDPSRLYSFIPVDQRSKFPDGELVLIRYEPVAFPDTYKDRYAEDDPESDNDAENPNYKPIRYLLYRDARGEMQSFWWYETDVQAMLAETGIRVPEPTPYGPSAPVVGDPASEPEVAVTSEPVESAPMVEPKESPDPAPVEVTEEPVAEEPSPIWPWILGVLILLGGLGLILARKKSRS